MTVYNEGNIEVARYRSYEVRAPKGLAIGKLLSLMGLF